MMTWDEFNAKFDKVAEKSDPDIRRTILDEFGSWRELALGILEMELYDVMKYSDICHAFTHEKQDAIRCAVAKNLSCKLDDLRKELSAL